jgi:hypothetical protein
MHCAGRITVNIAKLPKLVKLAATPLMPGSWTLGSAGALLTLAWNAVSEAQPLSLDRSGHGIRAMHERPNWSSVPKRVQSAAAEVPRNRFNARLLDAETGNHLSAFLDHALGCSSGRWEPHGTKRSAICCISCIAYTARHYLPPFY